MEPHDNFVEMNLADIRIDTYRTTPPSGWILRQETGVMITHIPSGVWVKESDDRSVYKNKAEAMRKMQIVWRLAPELFNPLPELKRIQETKEVAMEIVRNAQRYEKLKAMLEAGISADIVSRNAAAIGVPVNPCAELVYRVYTSTTEPGEKHVAHSLDHLVDSLTHVKPRIKPSK
jgi:hypothetical protein